MIKKIVYTLLFLCLLIGGIGYYYWNKPPRDVAAAEVDVFISATDFYKDYTSDEPASNAKYLDKVIAVEGTVAELELENAEEPTVALATESEDNSVRCGFKKEMLEEVKKLKTGDKIKIKGKCDGMGMFGIVITQCTLIKNK